MDIERIYNIFCRLTGLDEDSGMKYFNFCTNAADHVAYRLSDSVNDPKCSSRAEFAAAALANYRYALSVLTDGTGSEIKVGDITMKNDAAGAVAAAEKLCREAFDDLKGYLTDEGFVFKGV